METFLLGLGERLLQVGIHDERGSSGAVVTLISDGSNVRMFPARVPSSKVVDDGEPFYPSVPLGLAAGDLDRLEQVVLDTSELPSAVLAFSAEPFFEQAARHAAQTHVRLTPRDVEAWGLARRMANEH